MNPHSTTEFGSDRFFTKIQEHENLANGSGSATASIPVSTTFILPLREGRCSEDAPPQPDQKQKASFASSLRLKLLKTHSGAESDLLPYSKLDPSRRRRFVHPSH